MKTDSRAVASAENGAAARIKRKTVEIISGRDRRLQGEGEETGPRLQRDRSGVSEMEPLPATQDALRLELKVCQELGSPPPSLTPRLSPLFVARLGGTTVDSLASPPRRRHRHRRHRRHRRLYLHFRPSRRLTQRGETVSRHRRISRP